MLPVIFRKWKPRKEFGEEGGDIIALFPTIPSDTRNWYNVESYAHIGQHSGASPDIIADTVPATPKEYADLMKELHSVGYRGLKVVSKFTYAYQKEREQAWRKQMNMPDPHAPKAVAKAKAKKSHKSNGQASLGSMR